jgi:hypothetical protein
MDAEAACEGLPAHALEPRAKDTASLEEVEPSLPLAGGSELGVSRHTRHGLQPCTQAPPRPAVCKIDTHSQKFAQLLAFSHERRADSIVTASPERELELLHLHCILVEGCTGGGFSPVLLRYGGGSTGTVLASCPTGL